MFIKKNKYYLFIENTRDFNINLIKYRNKFHIIYRNNKPNEKISNLISFRRKCKQKGVYFFIANDTKLMQKINADGLYISSHNKKLLLNLYSRIGYEIIGSAHNHFEIRTKLFQRCKSIVYSRLFKTNYIEKRGNLGLNKFNFISLRSKINLIPLGGINLSNLNTLNSVKCNSFACLTAIKKKPAKFINRLF